MVRFSAKLAILLSRSPVITLLVPVLVGHAATDPTSKHRNNHDYYIADDCNEKTIHASAASPSNHHYLPGGPGGNLTGDPYNCCCNGG